MGRPKKLAKTTEKVMDVVEEAKIEETVETVETVETINEEDIVEVTEVEETEVPAEATILECVNIKSEFTEDDLMFKPGIPTGADPDDYVYNEPVINVNTNSDTEVIKPIRLDHLRQEKPKPNTKVTKASMACAGYASGVKITTKVAKLF